MTYKNNFPYIYGEVVFYPFSVLMNYSDYMLCFAMHFPLACIAKKLYNYYVYYTLGGDYVKYCPYCGNKLDDDMNFCPSCGKQYKGQTSNEACHISGQDSPCPNNSIDEMAPKKAVNTAFSPSAKNKSKHRIPVIVVAIFIITIALFVILKGDFSNFTRNTRRIQQATDSVVLVTCCDTHGNILATGSGFVLFDDSTIVTNFHVISGTVDIKISTDSDHTYSVESVIGYDKNKDIAILKTSEPTNLHPLKKGNSEKLNKGEAVVAIGSPLGNKNTVSTGNISGRWYNPENGLDELQFTAPISSGSSGGALFNGKGQVVGITSASFVDSQNLNLAIPIEEVDICLNQCTKACTPKECMVEVFGSKVESYFDAIPVDFSDLIDDPVSYFDKTIITEAYIAPMSNGHYMVLPTESAYMGDNINSSTSYIEAMSVMKNSAFDSNYRGYALISGECHGSSLYEPSFASKFNITPKIDMLYICYIEPR